MFTITSGSSEDQIVMPVSTSSLSGISSDWTEIEGAIFFPHYLISSSSPLSHTPFLLLNIPSSSSSYSEWLGVKWYLLIGFSAFAVVGVSAVVCCVVLCLSKRRTLTRRQRKPKNSSSKSSSAQMKDRLDGYHLFAPVLLDEDVSRTDRGYTISDYQPPTLEID
jgi:hypothetical protein